ncbi:hypothetical protein BCR39DRAFT_186061 [Naematelia encephala]|uniref:Uncharacterized protein n=1 Tax=Naematelia encephala TaxID=71784 RepID=A0A1Y2B1Q8_9TREE|nr:hypothetical protein BCR39DRAFT_186061 [Naematelia encephala]
MHPSLPSRPSFDLVPKEEIASGAPASKKRLTEHERDKLAYMPGPDAIPALQGSNLDAVNNRKEIRMANMSAADRLRAELSGDTGDADEPEAAADKGDTPSAAADAPDISVAQENPVDPSVIETEPVLPAEPADEAVVAPADDNMNEDEGPAADEGPISASNDSRGRKRKADEDDEDDENAEDADGSDVEAPPNPEADQPVPKKKLKVNPDGTVEGYFDDVR